MLLAPSLPASHVQQDAQEKECVVVLGVESPDDHPVRVVNVRVVCIEVACDVSNPPQHTHTHTRARLHTSAHKNPQHLSTAAAVATGLH